MNPDTPTDTLLSALYKGSHSKKKCLAFQNAVEDNSQLVLFEIQTGKLEPSKKASVDLKGILSPDLLLVDVRFIACESNSMFQVLVSRSVYSCGMKFCKSQVQGNHVVAGSNCQPSLFVFHIESDNSLLPVHEVVSVCCCVFPLKWRFECRVFPLKWRFECRVLKSKPMC